MSVLTTIQESERLFVKQKSGQFSLSVPVIPPSANSYVRHTHSGGHYKPKETLSWYEAVAILSRGEKVAGRCHSVTYRVYQGHNQKGDVDNYAKCILDSLVKAGVLESDASVVEIHGYKFRDKDNPRTEIEVISL